MLVSGIAPGILTGTNRHYMYYRTIYCCKYLSLPLLLLSLPPSPLLLRHPAVLLCLLPPLLLGSLPLFLLSGELLGRLCGLLSLFCLYTPARYIHACFDKEMNEDERKKEEWRDFRSV